MRYSTVFVKGKGRTRVRSEKLAPTELFESSRKCWLGMKKSYQPETYWPKNVSVQNVSGKKVLD